MDINQQWFMVYDGLWYANNELVTGVNLNQLITGGPHIVQGGTPKRYVRWFIIPIN